MIWFILPDSPERAKFLTKEEKEFIINRLSLETGSGQGRVTNNDKITPRHVLAAFKEWKIYCAILMFWANTIGVYGYVYAPTKDEWAAKSYLDSLQRCLQLSMILDILQRKLSC